MPCVQRRGFDVTSALTRIHQRLLEGLPSMADRLHLDTPQLAQTATGRVVMSLMQIPLDTGANQMKLISLCIAINEQTIV